jgi:phosphoribosylglycinamide formyltransferase 1
VPSILQAQRLHPTCHVGDVREAVRGEKIGDAVAAGTGSANHEDPTLIGQVLQSVRDVPHPHQESPRQGPLLPLLGLTHIEDRAAASRDPRFPILRRNLLDGRHTLDTLRLAHNLPCRESLYDLATNGRQGIIDIAVLISGAGSNLQALIDTPDLGARIAIVVSDRHGIRGLERAEAAGLETLVLPWERHTSRTEFSLAIADAVEQSGAKVMVLAGFMRLLSEEAVARFPNRILNIHPSLLPAFPGAHAVAQALANGVKVTGVTVHLVDEQVDHGPIVAQRAVPVLEGDDVESLHARIQVEEHDLYPKVVRAMAAGEISVQDGRVVWA